MNVDGMSALDLIDVIIEQIVKDGAVGLQFEEGGKILYCQVIDEEDLTDDAPELTSTRPLH